MVTRSEKFIREFGICSIPSTLSLLQISGKFLFSGTKIFFGKKFMTNTILLFDIWKFVMLYKINISMCHTNFEKSDK